MGVPDEMTPGDITKLGRSSKLAIRVRLLDIEAMKTRLLMTVPWCISSALSPALRTVSQGRAGCISFPRRQWQQSESPAGTNRSSPISHGFREDTALEKICFCDSQGLSTLRLQDEAIQYAWNRWGTFTTRSCRSVARQLD
jgi:hypothetical protein